MIAGAFLLPVLLIFLGCSGPKSPDADDDAAGPSKARATETPPAPVADTAKSGSARNDGEPAPVPKKPNIVVVLLDTVRPDYLGFYGFERETAPFLASLAEEAIVFDNAYSASSWTAPATASLFTSLYPPQHGVTQGFRAHRGMVAKLKAAGESKIPLNAIPGDVTTLSELLESAGYRTYGFAANINIGDEIGFSRGFDHFEKKVKVRAEVFAETLEGMKEELLGGDDPYFLYLHLNDAHSPYEKMRPYYRPSSDKKKDFAARYRSEISYIDATLKKIFALVRDRENTAFVVLSDHGEEFWDHGGTEHGPQLYRELHRILMMMGMPGSGPARIAQNASILDVYPTLADLAGVEIPHAEEGISLKPIVAGTEGKEALLERMASRTLFGHRVYSSKRQVSVWAAVQGRWRLIDWWGGRRKLFDEVDDPGNVFNLTTKRPKITEALTERLGRFKKRMEKDAADAGAETEVTLDNTLLERLGKLGYVE